MQWKETRQLYVEGQEGDQCRKHAINNHFGGPVLTWHELETQAAAFQQQYQLGERFQAIDYFNADGTSLLTYLAESLDADHLYVVLPLGHAETFADHLGVDVAALPRCMVFHQGHVWACRNVQGQWYTLDSLSPWPRAMNRFRMDAHQGMVVGLTVKAVHACLHRLKDHIGRLTLGSVRRMEEFIGRDRLIGDAHPFLENWVCLRLRMLAWLRGRGSRTHRLWRHWCNATSATADGKRMVLYAALMD